jgi:hypothetical protein
MVDVKCDGCGRTRTMKRYQANQLKTSYCETCYPAFKKAKVEPIVKSYTPEEDRAMIEEWLSNNEVTRIDDDS